MKFKCKTKINEGKIFHWKVVEKFLVTLFLFSQQKMIDHNQS